MTKHHTAALRILIVAILLASGALSVTGCFNPFSPRVASQRGRSSPPPVPSSATGVVQLFAWCWNNRALQEYSEIFDAQFRFQFSAVDTSGQGGTGEYLDREQELETARHLFAEGTASEPPAQSIVLTLDQVLRDDPDSRAGKDPTWHRQITTTVQLRIKTEEQEFQITGNALFFVVRGDSVNIPPQIADRFSRDPNRWWIERWEDDTDQGPAGANADRRALMDAALRQSGMLAPGSAAALPLTVSWGRVKFAYLDR